MCARRRGGAEGEDAEGQEDTSDHCHDETPFRLNLSLVLAQLRDSDAVVIVSKADIGKDTSDDLLKQRLIFCARPRLGTEGPTRPR